MTDIQNYNFKTKLGSEHNLLKMMAGDEKYSLGDHIRVIWISFKQMIGASVSSQEKTEKEVYDTVKKMVKATARCFSICAEILPAQPTLKGVKQTINDEILEGATTKIKTHLFTLRNLKLDFDASKLCSVTDKAIVTDIAEMAAEKLGTPLESDSDDAILPGTYGYKGSSTISPLNGSPTSSIDTE